MNARLLCVLVALSALSCSQAWPYMNPYILSRMLGSMGMGGGGEGGFGGMGGFGGGEGGFGGMGGFGGGEGAGQLGAGGAEGGAGAAGGDDEAGGAGGEGGAAAGGEGGAPGGAEGGQMFPTAFPMGLGNLGYMGFNRFPTMGYGRINPFFRPNPFYRFNPTPQPWFLGPNVCRNVTEDGGSEAEAGQEEQGEDDVRQHFSARTEVCDKLDTAYKCTRTQYLASGTKTQVEIYECCHGHTRKPGQFGCPIDLQLKDLPGTAAKLGLQQLLRALEGTSLTEELQLGTFTVFAPTDLAFNASTPTARPTDAKLQEMLQDKVVVASEPLTSLVLDDMQNLLLGHLVSGIRKTHHFRDEEVVETASPEGEGIRVNLYHQPGKSQLMTANCVRVLSTDNQATNGVIHTVESVLRPVTDSLTDLVSKNPQLSYLKTALAKAGLVQKLREPGQFSLLAPTDTAFRKLKPAQLDRLLRGNPKCLEKVLLNHLLPNVICTAAISGRAKTPNSLDSYLKLSRDQDDKLFVEGSQVIVKDIMATNGVLHLLDDVLIPDEAKDLLETAQARELTQFLQMVDKAGLSQTLTDADNVTVFVPSNAAFKGLPDDVQKQLANSPQLLRDVLTYHVVPGARRCSGLHSDQLLDTLLPAKQVRINEYNSYPFRHDFIQTAQCAPVVERNVPACNGIIHVIDKVMLPPSGDVLDVLSRDSRFTTLVSLLKKAGLAESLQQQDSLTVFAPSNQAFEKLDRKTTDQLTSNPEALKKTLLNHVTNDVLCCSGFFERSWFSHPRVRMLGGAVLTLERRGESPRVSNAAILDCDRSATNGVVHLLDSVLVVEERPRRYWRGYYDY